MALSTGAGACTAASAAGASATGASSTRAGIASSSSAFNSASISAADFSFVFLTAGFLSASLFSSAFVLSFPGLAPFFSSFVSSFLTADGAAAAPGFCTTSAWAFLSGWADTSAAGLASAAIGAVIVSAGTVSSGAGAGFAEVLLLITEGFIRFSSTSTACCGFSFSFSFCVIFLARKLLPGPWIPTV